LYYAKDNPHPICKYCYDTKHEENELEGPDFIGLYTCPSCGRQYQRRAD
jgi:transposase-like protein